MKKYIWKRVAVAWMLTAAILFGMEGSGQYRLQTFAAPTREDYENAKKEKEELEKKKNELNGNIDDMKGTQNTLKGELGNLNRQLTEISNNLVALEGRIAGKKKEIEETQDALLQAKEVEASQYRSMVWRVRKMYEQNDRGNVSGMVNSLLGSANFADMLNTADGYEKVMSYDQLQYDKFQENRKLIEQHEALLQQEKAELDDLKTEALAEQNKVSGLVSATGNAISKYSKQIEDAEAQALAYEKEIKDKEDQIAQIAKELELSKTAANGVWRDISEVEFAEGDRYLLANLIYCEAGAEPYDGKVAVGAVVINRVLSGSFPDTVVGVIYQNKQFSPVGSGRLELALSTNRATPECYRAADEAMSGVSNVGNCLFFRTPVPGLEGISIGGHVFY